MVSLDKLVSKSIHPAVLLSYCGEMPWLQQVVEERVIDLWFQGVGVCPTKKPWKQEKKWWLEQKLRACICNGK